MRKYVKYLVIEDAVKSLKEQINLLREVKTKLEQDINKIGEGYKGQDSLEIIKKYQEKVGLINTYINVVETYNDYFIWIGENYGNSQQKAINNFENINEINTDILNMKLNI